MEREAVAKLKAIFLEANDLQGAQRARYLDKVCAEDSELRAQVEQLLDQDSSTTSRLLPSSQPEPIARGLIADGTVLSGRFKIREFVGCGGMGEVYSAEDLELGGTVALKTVKSRFALDERRFLREIQISRQVTHPNICRVFDVGHHETSGGNRLTFLTMELLEGETLKDHLKQHGRIAPSQAIQYANQLAAGLHALHEKGVVHRDLKPGNVMLAAESLQRMVIMDFGLARAFEGLSDATELTQTGLVLGTPGYMAPEQLEGKPATAATDIYCLGVLLYEMVSGTRLSMAGALVAGKTGLPAEWEECILACLERDPARRPASAMIAVEPLTVTREMIRQQQPAARKVPKLALVAAGVALASGGLWFGPLLLRLLPP